LGPRLVGGVGLTVVGGLERGRGGVAGARFDLAVEASLVEPVDVGECGELDVFEPRPWAFRVDQLPLVEPVEALDQGVESPIEVKFYAADAI
jgi:hypothetical protein